jgi:hypothetical protein
VSAAGRQSVTNNQQKLFINLLCFISAIVGVIARLPQADKASPTINKPFILLLLFIP